MRRQAGSGHLREPEVAAHVIALVLAEEGVDARLPEVTLAIALPGDCVDLRVCILFAHTLDVHHDLRVLRVLPREMRERLRCLMIVGVAHSHGKIGVGVELDVFTW